MALPSTNLLGTEIAATPLAMLVDRYPGLVPVLDRFGLDTCCGGHLTPPEAADAHGLDPAELMSALARAAQPGGLP